MGYGRLFGSNGKYIGQVSNFYHKLDDNKMHIETDNGRRLIFNPSDLLRDGQGDWHIVTMPNHSKIADIVDAAFKREALYHRGGVRKEEPSMNTGLIKNVIFNPPATVVYWTDGTKTVVKCNENDIFDPEKGLAMAIAKRCGSNKGNYYKEIQKWVKKSGYVQPMADTTVEKAKVNTPKPSAPEHSSEKFKKAVANAKEHYDKYVQAATDGEATTAFKEYTALGAALTMIEYLANE